MRSRLSRLDRRAGLAAAVLLAMAATAHAQPFGSWMTGSATAGRYIEIADSPDFTVTRVTIEAWVLASSPSPGECRSIIGKNYLEAFWVGYCTDGASHPILRSYLRGGGSAQTMGTILASEWTHVVVTFDGVKRRHYINGEEVLTFDETIAPTSSTAPVRIGSDVSWDYQPRGALDEVRFWNVARTTEQIRSTINVRLDAPQSGLVAVWPLDGGGLDELGAHSGSAVGGPTFLTHPVSAGCVPSATALCLGGRISVGVRWATPGGTTGVGTVVPGASADSGLFWFFNADNWEILVKALNGCGVNGRRWAFSAATTNVFYRLEATDVVGGASKIYFNYQGISAPAVTDVNAFATCP